jgi:hypothetical protein
MEIKQPFFVDQKQPGVVRGGPFDASGGILVGVHSYEICDMLNDRQRLTSLEQELREALTKLRDSRQECERLRAANGELWKQQCETSKDNERLTAENSRMKLLLERTKTFMQEMGTKSGQTISTAWVLGMVESALPITPSGRQCPVHGDNPQPDTCTECDQLNPAR